MVKITSLIAVISSCAFVSALPSAINSTVATSVAFPKTIPTSIPLRDVDGNVTGEYVFTPYEMAAFKNMSIAEEASPGLSERGYWGDIEFFLNDWTDVIRGPGISVAYLYRWKLYAKWWGVPFCDNSKYDYALFEAAACYKPFWLNNNWYMVNNCVPREYVNNWEKVQEGSWIGGLVTWNDRYIGNCYAKRDYREVNHYCDNPVMPKLFSNVKVVECNMF